MAINFKKIAQEQTFISTIMEGRTKVEKTDGVVTIYDFDIVPSKKGEAYAVCAISDKHFINGGYVLSKIFKAIVDEFEGDVDAAREDFRNSGGLKVRLEKSRTQDGKSITKVEVL